MDSSCRFFPADIPWATAPVSGTVDPEAVARHRRWISSGRHAEMAYMDRYHDVRADLGLLLPGARSLACVAFPYFTDEPVRLPISLYARGRDYHEVVRERLTEIARRLPGSSRVCVDTAPLRERYWAERLGLGFIGRNNQLIIPGLGSYFFLGFIVTTALLPAARSRPATTTAAGCGDCRRCVDACPGGALFSDGSALDSRRCLSYLTIEHRGPLPGPLTTLYGCDICQRVCPHNATPVPTPIADFHPSPRLRELNAAQLAAMTPAEFSAIFRHSAIRRTKLAGLQRNLANLIGVAGVKSV